MKLTTFLYQNPLQWLAPSLKSIFRWFLQLKTVTILIQPAFEEELHKYISGIITGKEQKSLAVNGMPDHIHLLVG